MIRFRGPQVVHSDSPLSMTNAERHADFGGCAPSSAAYAATSLTVDRLERHDFVEGRNPRVEVRRGGHSRGEDVEVVRALVASQPDVILVDTTPLALRTREATTTIPIVFTGVPIRSAPA